MPETVVMGKVGAPHGMRGWVGVWPATSDLETLCGHPTWHLKDSAGNERRLSLEQGRVQGNKLVVKLRGVDSREAAGELSGMEILVARGELAPLAADCHYWCDLIGMDVRAASGGESLGRVRDVMRLPSNDVLVLDAGGKELLVPFVKDCVREVNHASRQIIADWERDY